MPVPILCVALVMVILVLGLVTGDYSAGDWRLVIGDYVHCARQYGLGGMAGWRVDRLR